MKSPKLRWLIGSAMLALSLSACSNSSSADDSFNAAAVCPVEGLNDYGEPNRGTFTDPRDGQEYKYVTIGNQVWMAEYLNYDDGSRCADSACVKGRIYALESALNVCPMGWHLPSYEEWLTLFGNVGGIDSAGLRLKATEGWIPLNPGISSNGTDDCGFALLPIPASTIAGNNIYDKDKRDGYIAFAWTSSLLNDYTMYAPLFETQRLDARIEYYYTGDYLPVRCVKD